MFPALYVIVQLRVAESNTSVQQQQQQQQRQRHLQEACLASNDSWSDSVQLIVNHKLRLIVCIVGKVAYTSWLRVLLQLTGNPAAQLLAGTDRTSIQGMFKYYLDLASFGNATQFAGSPFKDYYKFMFVREPFERLVSAYQDKMFRAGNYVSLRRYIIRTNRRNPSSR